jgi:hypothetical protein
MSWGLKRKILYGGGLLVFLLILIGIPSYLALRTEPTCFDGKKNGNEAGIDCGGSCELVCSFQAVDPIVRWDESFEVRPGVWGALAYIDNPNEALAENVTYVFRFVDEKGVTIALREGETYIPPGATFAIFESDIDLGERSPSQEFFTFDSEAIVWLRPSGERMSLRVDSTQVSQSAVGTRLSGVVVNPSASQVRNVEVIGIMYDLEGNVLAASETYIDTLGGNESENVVFTWPRNFSEVVARREILYKVIPE